MIEDVALPWAGCQAEEAAPYQGTALAVPPDPLVIPSQRPAFSGLKEQ